MVKGVVVGGNGSSGGMAAAAGAVGNTIGFMSMGRSKVCLAGVGSSGVGVGVSSHGGVAVFGVKQQVVGKCVCGGGVNVQQQQQRPHPHGPSQGCCCCWCCCCCFCHSGAQLHGGLCASAAFMLVCCVLTSVYVYCICAVCECVV
jgi:hypothetical protein